jgi:glycosyltransferase involved in cell wall biosynthesis
MPNDPQSVAARGILAERRGIDAEIPSYILITPARNEAQFIELVLESVTRQTAKPLRWVIVSDGSTDGTDEIVEGYASRHAWIELVRMPRRAERHFAGKALAFNAGRERVRHLQYDVIGNLDADVSFGEDYFRYLMLQFAADRLLGVAGTPFAEGGKGYDYRFTSIEHVSGICQLFRRECFDQLGGYPLIRGGGIDLVAVTTARMNGWKTRTFPEMVCHHHRLLGAGQSGVWRTYFRYGKQDFYLGGHVVWELFRCIYQMKSRPYVVRGLLLLCGYVYAFAQGAEKPVSRRFVRFRRKEQMLRLKRFFRDRLCPGGSPAESRDGAS